MAPCQGVKLGKQINSAPEWAVIVTVHVAVVGCQS